MPTPPPSSLLNGSLNSLSRQNASTSSLAHVPLERRRSREGGVGEAAKQLLLRSKRSFGSLKPRKNSFAEPESQRLFPLLRRRDSGSSWGNEARALEDSPPDTPTAATMAAALATHAPPVGLEPPQRPARPSGAGEATRVPRHADALPLAEAQRLLRHQLPPICLRDEARYEQRLRSQPAPEPENELVKPAGGAAEPAAGPSARERVRQERSRQMQARTAAEPATPGSGRSQSRAPREHRRGRVLDAEPALEQQLAALDGELATLAVSYRGTASERPPAVRRMTDASLTSRPSRAATPPFPARFSPASSVGSHPLPSRFSPASSATPYVSSESSAEGQATQRTSAAFSDGIEARLSSSTSLSRLSFGEVLRVQRAERARAIYHAQTVCLRAWAKRNGGPRPEQAPHSVSASHRLLMAAAYDVLSFEGMLALAREVGAEERAEAFAACARDHFASMFMPHYEEVSLGFPAVQAAVRRAAGLPTSPTSPYKAGKATPARPGLRFLLAQALHLDERRTEDVLAGFVERSEPVQPLLTSELVGSVYATLPNADSDNSQLLIDTLCTYLATYPALQPGA